MGDVGLGVELFLVVDPALDLPGPERFEDRGDPVQEGVRLLVLLDALVEPVERLRPNRLQNGLAGPVGGLRAHQDPDLVQSLPFAVEGEQGADLEIPGRDVERLRDAAPLLQVPEPGPAGDAVVDDEELAALGVNAHDVPGAPLPAALAGYSQTPSSQPPAGSGRRRPDPAGVIIDDARVQTPVATLAATSASTARRRRLAVEELVSVPFFRLRHRGRSGARRRPARATPAGLPGSGADGRGGGRIGKLGRAGRRRFGGERRADADARGDAARAGQGDARERARRAGEPRERWGRWQSCLGYRIPWSPGAFTCAFCAVSTALTRPSSRSNLRFSARTS